MKARDLNDWIGVITNIGVIAGLILVAYEINQNNVAMDRDARIARVELADGIRGQWQNWEYAIVENRDLSDIWMRGNAGESLDSLEEFRYGQLAKEMYRLTSQNYKQYSLLTGEPADWAVWQLAGSAKGNPRLKAIFIEQLERPMLRQDTESYSDFRNRVKELGPVELRKDSQ